MAVQAGLAASKILLILGASVAGSILLKNGSLSDFLGDTYKVFVKHLNREFESSKESSIDAALIAQVSRLRQELSRLAAERSTLTVVNGSSKANGNAISVAVPVLVIGATGYCYLRWKGLSLSDVTYVTRRSMSNAAASLSKQLENVSAALAATKRQLTSRLEHLTSNLDQTIEMQGEVKDEVREVRGEVARVGLEIETVQRLVEGLEVKIDSIEGKQDLANHGVIFLCQYVQGLDGVQRSEALQGINRPRLEYATSSPGSSGLKELQYLSEALESSESSISSSDSTTQVHNEATTSSSSPRPRLQRSFTSSLSVGLTRLSFFQKP